MISKLLTFTRIAVRLSIGLFGVVSIAESAVESSLSSAGELVVYQVNDERRPFFFKPSASEVDNLKQNKFFKDFYDEEEEIAGIDVYLAKKLSHYLGMSLRWDRSAETFSEVCDLVHGSKVPAVGISKLSMTPERAEKVKFSTPYMRIESLLLLSREGQKKVKLGDIFEPETNQPRPTGVDLISRPFYSSNSGKRFVKPSFSLEGSMKVGRVLGTSYYDFIEDIIDQEKSNRDGSDIKIEKELELVNFDSGNLKERVESLFEALAGRLGPDKNIDATLYDEIEFAFRKRRDQDLRVSTLDLPIRGRADFLAIAINPSQRAVERVANVVVKRAEGRIEQFREFSIKSVPIDEIAVRASSSNSALVALVLFSVLSLIFLYYCAKKCNAQVSIGIDKRQLSRRDPRQGMSWLFDILAITAGVWLGRKYPEVSTSQLKNVADAYIMALATMVIPLVITNIIISLTDLVRSKSRAGLVPAVIARYAMTSLASASLGVLCGYILISWVQSTDGFQEQLAVLFSGMDNEAPKTTSGIWTLVKSIVPNSLPSLVPIVFWSIATGLVIGNLTGSGAKAAIVTPLVAIREIASNFLSQLMRLLPIALICMAASLTATFQGLTFIVVQFALVFVGGCIVVCAISVIAIKRSTGASTRKIFENLGGALMLATLARSSLVAVEDALSGMRKLGVRDEAMSALVPLGMTINRQAYPMLFSMLSVFVLVMAGQIVGIKEVLWIVVIFAIVGSMAVGAPVVVAVMITPAMLFVDMALSEVTIAVAIVGTINAFVDPAASGTHLLSSTSVATTMRAEE